MRAPWRTHHLTRMDLENRLHGLHQIVGDRRRREMPLHRVHSRATQCDDRGTLVRKQPVGREVLLEE